MEKKRMTRDEKIKLLKNIATGQGTILEAVEKNREVWTEKSDGSFCSPDCALLLNRLQLASRISRIKRHTDFTILNLYTQPEKIPGFEFDVTISI